MPVLRRRCSRETQPSADTRTRGASGRVVIIRHSLDQFNFDHISVIQKKSLN